MTESQVSVRADRKGPFPYVSVIAGVVWALGCVVLTFRGLLSMGAGAGGAFIGTAVVMGVPVAFVAIRVAICLNAYEKQVPVAFWPGDRSSTAAKWGLLPLMFYFGIVSLLAFTEVDQTFFSGQIGRLLQDTSE